MRLLSSLGTLLGSLLGLLGPSSGVSRAKKCRQSHAKSTFSKVFLLVSRSPFWFSWAPLGLSRARLGAQMAPKRGPKGALGHLRACNAPAWPFFNSLSGIRNVQGAKTAAVTFPQVCNQPGGTKPTSTWQWGHRQPHNLKHQLWPLGHQQHIWGAFIALPQLFLT